MLSKAQAALAKLLRPSEPLLVGVSGGADSVVLLDVLVELGWRPHVCHLNHQLRGADSDADAEFVRQLAQRYGLPCTLAVAEGLAGAASPPAGLKLHPVIRGKLPRGEGPPRPRSGRDEDAAPTGKGLEDACRQARFGFFESVAARTGIQALALAHTADDQVETFLLKLLRGAGAPGLAGMWPDRQLGTLRVIRPLLGVTRAEVLAYLRAAGLGYREDATNVDPRFTRNRIRHRLLPLLEQEFNPSIRDVLARTAEILREEDRYLDELARAHVAEALHVPTLAKLPVALQRRVIRQWLGVEFEHVEAVRTATGAVTLPGGWVVQRDREWWRRVKTDESQLPTGPWPVAVTGETVIAELGVRLVANLPFGCNICYAQKGNWEAVLDADALGPRLTVRTWRAGDRFQPLGMRGEKKLQDFFVDQKVPRRNRGRVPLLCAGNGRIAWVVGHRIADPFKVTEHTKRIVRVRVERVRGP